MQSKKWKKSGSETRGRQKPAQKRNPQGDFTRNSKPRHTSTQSKQAGTSARALRATADTYLLWGQHAAEAALANPNRNIRRIYVTDESAKRVHDMITSLPQARQKQLPEMQIEDRARFDALGSDANKALHQQFVLDVVPIEGPDLTDLLYADGGVRLLVLDQVTDPRNIGAMMRSARAFGAAAVVMTRKHAPDEGGVLARAAAGALEHVPIIQVTNLARALEMMSDHNVHLAGLEASGPVDLHHLASQPRLAIIMGSEGDGMRRLTREACHSLASIPMSDTSESLNVSVAAAIALYATQPR